MHGPADDENDSERRIRRILTERIGLCVRRIPRDSNGRTADFEVFLGDRLLFVVEVKNINCHDVPVFAVPGTRREDVTMLGGLRDDNGPMRISRVIVRGAEQLANYGSLKVLVIVNDEDAMAFNEDFRPGFRGHQQVSTAFHGAPEFAYLAPRVVREQLEKAWNVIDLYVWVDSHANRGERDLWFASRTDCGNRLGQDYFRDHINRF